MQEYHREPIAYALALAELNTAVLKVTRRRHPDAIASFTLTSSLNRRSRDVLGNNDYGSDENIAGLNVLQILRYWRIECSKILNSSLITNFRGFKSKAPDLDTLIARRQDESLTAWEKQFENFVKNVNFFCQHTGSEVDDLAPPRETINNLRKFASDRRQELAPLLEVNARLNKELTSYKRINAALQIRHTIEKLTFELPDTAQYDFPGSGPKWRVLWDQIWANASRNENNPFHNLWTQSTGEYARDNIRDKGRNLFADMSGEIHGYDQRRRNAFDYEHFDISAQRVATILQANPIVDQTTGDVDWAHEIRKYPIAWPTADNLALNLLQRLEGRVGNLQSRLDIAVEERNRERDRQARIQAQRDAGQDLHQQRLRDGNANNAARDDLEEDNGIEALFSNEE